MTTATMRILASLQAAVLLLQLAAPYEAATLQHRPARKNPTLPRGGKVAILLRGQSSRCHDDGGRSACCQGALGEQELATFSLLENVIKPLESSGNVVKMVVTDGECTLTSNLTSLLEWGRQGRVLHVEHGSFYDTPTPQSGNLRFALETFKKAMQGGAKEIARGVDLVLVLRHDTVWKLPIDQWPEEANFTKFNFASRCEESASYPTCMNDMIFTMPGSLFPAFDAEVGTKFCFYAAPGHCQLGVYCGLDCGHMCKGQLQRRMGEEKMGFLTKWRPDAKVRESNDIWETYDVICGCT